MIEKTILLVCTSRLLELANARGTSQGVTVYEGVLKKISEASSQSEVNEYAEKLKHALNGIEAHGHFTSEEFEIVKAIRELH